MCFTHVKECRWSTRSVGVVCDMWCVVCWCGWCVWNAVVVVLWWIVVFALLVVPVVVDVSLL